MQAVPARWRDQVLSEQLCWDGNSAAPANIHPSDSFYMVLRAVPGTLVGFCYRVLLQRRNFEAVGGIPNTAIVIAHRLSTVTGGHYRRLFDRQAGLSTPEIA